MATKVRFSNPATIAKPPGYTHVVEISGQGRIVYFAGQLGLDRDNNLVGAPGDFRTQATQAFENMRLALKSVGGSFKDVVKINNYLTDMSHIGLFREVRDQFLNTAAPPASTTVAIAALARPGALFEIEAIAVLGANAPAKSSKANAVKKTAMKTARTAKSKKKKR